MAEEIVLIPELDHDHLPCGALNQLVCAALTLQTSEKFARDHPLAGCALLLLLDTSSSMDEPFVAGQAGLSKRQAVLRAAEALLPELLPEDRVSLAFFDSRAYTIVEQLAGSARRELRAALQRITEFTGGTNFEAAFAAAHGWATAASSAGAGSRRVLFLTDGQMTEGRPAEVTRLDAELARLGVTVDCLGAGTDFAFAEMQRLSLPSGGRTLHLDAHESAAQQFRELLQTAQRSLVHNVLLRLRVPRQHRDVELYQLSPEVRFFDALGREPDGTVEHMVQIGSLSQVGSHGFVLAARVDVPAAAGPFELCRCRLDYSIPRLGLASASLEQRVQLNAGGRESWDSTVTAQHQEASLARHELDFRRKLGQSWQEAAQILGRMVAIAEGLQLADKVATYRQYRERLQQQHGLSQDELNRLFARTSRSTLAPGARVSRGAPVLDF